MGSRPVGQGALDKERWTRGKQKWWYVRSSVLGLPLVLRRRQLVSLLGRLRVAPPVIGAWLLVQDLLLGQHSGGSQVRWLLQYNSVVQDLRGVGVGVEGVVVVGRRRRTVEDVRGGLLVLRVVMLEEAVVEAGRIAFESGSVLGIEFLESKRVQKLFRYTCRQVTKTRARTDVPEARCC